MSQFRSESRSPAEFISEGRALASRGQAEDALLHLQTGLAYYPADERLNREIIAHYAKAERNIDAFRAGIAWYRNDPNNPNCLDVLADIAEVLGEKDDAAKWRKQAAEARAPSSAFGGFGGGQQQPAFGGFGAPAQQPAFGGFGAQQQPAFGGFGAQQQKPAFGGAPAQQPAFGGFGAQQQPAFGGAPAQQPAFGGFGAQPQPAPADAARPFTFLANHSVRSEADANQLQAVLARFVSAFRDDATIHLAIVIDGAGDRPDLAQSVQRAAEQIDQTGNASRLTLTFA